MLAMCQTLCNNWRQSGKRSNAMGNPATGYHENILNSTTLHHQPITLHGKYKSDTTK